RLEIGAGGETLLHQRGLAVVIFLGVGDGVVRRLDVGAGALIADLVGVELHLRGRDRRLGLRNRDPIGLGIDPEEQVAGLDRLVLLHAHFDDAARHVGRDRALVLLDIGIVGRDAVAAGEVEIAHDRQQDGRHAEHQQRAQQAALRLG
ncbi:hypothetical protein QU40_00300, partial [Staphylococcus aureus]